MSGNNDVNTERLGARDRLLKTETADLTFKEMRAYKIITGTHASSAIALTLPAAADVLAGMVRFVCCGGAAAVTVVVDDGYGGGSNTIITLAEGECVMIVCDGTAWHAGTLATGDISS